MKNRHMHAFNRRRFMASLGILFGAGALEAKLDSYALGVKNNSDAIIARTAQKDIWSEVRAQFDLDPSYTHFASFVLAAHPKPVREAIERHCSALDKNTDLYLSENGGRLADAVLGAASSYLSADPEDIALTDSTTMGLGLLYGGLRLKKEQEILTTEHDFYATHESLRLRAARTGALVRKIALYRDIRRVTIDEIVETIRLAIRPQTRLLALTWVHSSTGLKLPIRTIAEMLAKLNANRNIEDRVLLCVDGVHGFGVENVTVSELGCDFLVSGCHKWLYGPRGTGLIWGKREAWFSAMATIPTFDGRSIFAWIQRSEPSDLPLAAAMTPGGYHSFEHRWALAEAFELHAQIGKAQIEARIHLLSRQLKEGLAAMPHVTLYTPIAENLSAGIVCFTISGVSSEEVVSRLLRKHRIVASVTPYAARYVRFGASIMNSPEEVQRALKAIAELRR
jgi:selenocysteine lyase/cysteine desulfurase